MNIRFINVLKNRFRVDLSLTLSDSGTSDQ
jgi:hypothetical protein